MNLVDCFIIVQNAPSLIFFVEQVINTCNTTSSFDDGGWRTSRGKCWSWSSGQHYQSDEVHEKNREHHCISNVQSSLRMEQECITMFSINCSNERSWDAKSKEWWEIWNKNATDWFHTHAQVKALEIYPMNWYPNVVFQAIFSCWVIYWSKRVSALLPERNTFRPQITIDYTSWSKCSPYEIWSSWTNCLLPMYCFTLSSIKWQCLHSSCTSSFFLVAWTNWIRNVSTVNETPIESVCLTITVFFTVSRILARADCNSCCMVDFQL